MANIDNFTGSIRQKMFAADIINKAVDRLNYRIADTALRIEARKAAGEKTAKTERSLEQDQAQLARINTMMAGKKIAAKKIIESAEKTDEFTGGKYDTSFILSI